MSGGGVSAPTIQPLKQQLVQAPQPALTNPSAFQYPGFLANGSSSGFFNNGGVPQYAFQDVWGQKLSQQLGDTFQQGANAFGALGQTVQPGFSLFRQQGLQDIENQRQANQSNLQGNLANRRMLGSSFANSSVSNANADFAQKQGDFIAQSYLEELAASSQLTQQQYAMATQGFQAQLQQSNVDTAMAADLSSKMASTMASLAETQGQLDLSAAQTNAQAAMLQAQMQLQAGEFNAQMQMAEMMGIGQLAGGLLGGMGGGGKSDIRVKRDISRIGTWLNGLPIYLFRYIFEPRWHIGFMAQDVELVMPEAVYEVDGIKHVNYGLAIRG